MEVSLSQAPNRAALPPVAALGKLAIGAMVGVAALLVYAQAAIFGGFNPIVSAIAMVALGAAGVILTRRRWAPAAAAVVCGLLLGLLAMLGGELAFMLSNPGSPMFAFIVVALTVLAVGLVASVGAAIQNYRSVRTTPRALVPGLALVAGLVAGALVVAGIPHAGSPAGVSAEALAGLPAVTLDKFDNGQIRVKAGENVALRLENVDGVDHAFVVDELGVSAPMPAGQNSLALFKAAKPGSYTFYCTPHYDKATGEGMHGTIVVE